MSAASETFTPRSDAERLLHDVERLLQDLQALAASGNLTFSVDTEDQLFIAWFYGPQTPYFCDHGGRWWIARTDHCKLRLQMPAVRQVRFVREPDRRAPGRETISVRFSGEGGASTLHASFEPLYDNQGQPIPAQFARWEELRAKYGSE